MHEPDDLTGQHAQLACIWEATARKPGNVHRFRDFDDVSYLDFLTSAAVVAPLLATVDRRTVGATVLACIERTRQVVRTNTNLGIVLLLAPLAKARPGDDYRESVATVLDALDVDDALAVCRAICLANPGGLGRVEEGDVREPPTVSLQALMTLAADRDLIARQYANGFAEVFEVGAPAVLEGIGRTGCLEEGIVHAHLRLMSCHADSLIARRRGVNEANESARRAGEVLALGWPETVAGRQAMGALDGWLRAVGNARNPGTTADLVAASLFVLLRQGRLRTPLEIPWARMEDAP